MLTLSMADMRKNINKKCARDIQYKSFCHARRLDGQTWLITMICIVVVVVVVVLTYFLNTWPLSLWLSPHIDIHFFFKGFAMHAIIIFLKLLIKASKSYFKFRVIVQQILK